MRPGTGRERARAQVVLYCRRMLAESLVDFTAGNISVRVDGEPGLYAVTPTGAPYDSLESTDVCLATIDGEVVAGRLKPTTEFPLHTLTYRRRPEVGAIVHTHSSGAMTMAALGWTLPPILTGLVAAVGGAVRTAPYARPGTEKLADVTSRALADRGACFLRHHGLLAIGATLHHAYNAASVTEGAAEVYLRARAFGPVPELPEEEVAWIAAAWREQWPSAGTGSPA
jgi:ribulose-5-phosphate 4-epimerase/fuculose-1-phosphate aldolase